MEYTRSKGDDYETFEGMPEEIAKLVKDLDKAAEVSESPLVKFFRGLNAGGLPGIDVPIPEMKIPTSGTGTGFAIKGD